MITGGTNPIGLAMAKLQEKQKVYAVGIDLGTTYSSVAYLTPQGQPVTLPNAEGELSTPSIVLFDGDEVVVGTEALRHSITAPERVVSHAKRYMGDPNKCWVFDGHVYRPKDIAAFVVRKLLDGAEERLGKIHHAVITVPAQFSELQRRDTVEAGLQAGLQRVDIINEPVAAALCYVLGEGMWFAELANDQTVMVFDLGGGTFDLSLVKYNKQAVRVIASGGDLRLGGLDWNKALEEFVCDEFIRESISDPRLDRESMQALAIEVEQVKRSLSVRPRSSLVVQHEGRRKVYTIDRDQFELLTRPLLDRTEKLTREMLKQHGLGWANVDAILATGGSSRMPMVRNMLQRIGGSTLNQSLSPDQSICHGAAYYAGMLLSGQKMQKSVLDRKVKNRLSSFHQQSVSGRALGILVRDMQTQQRVPHYLIPANTPLPCAYRQRFGTVVPGQKRVHLHIVESGTSASDPHVELGECRIEGLPENLPESSPIEITIRYDEQARLHVEAVDVTSGLRAQTTIVRPSLPPPTETSAQQQPAAATSVTPEARPDTFRIMPGDTPPVPVQEPTPERRPAAAKASGEGAGRPQPVLPKGVPVKSAAAPRVPARVSLEQADRPIPLCNTCGEVLDVKGRCPQCSAKAKAGQRPSAGTRPAGAARRPENEAVTERMAGPPPIPGQRITKVRKKP